jgi:hypothetical protein
MDFTKRIDLIEFSDEPHAHVSWNAEVVLILLYKGFVLNFHCSIRHFELIKLYFSQVHPNFDYNNFTFVSHLYPQNSFIKFLYLKKYFHSNKNSCILLSSTPLEFLLEFFFIRKNFSICIHSISIYLKNSFKFKFIFNGILFLDKIKQSLKFQTNRKNSLLLQRKLNDFPELYYKGILTHGLVSVSLNKSEENRFVFLGVPRFNKRFDLFLKFSVITPEIPFLIFFDGLIKFDILSLVNVKQQFLKRPVVLELSSNDIVFCCYDSVYNFIFSATVIEALSANSILLVNEVALSFIQELKIPYIEVSPTELNVKFNLIENTCLIRRK